METLSQAQVKNFQSVADVTVDFGKFTVMVGQSNSGKSAFLRGVRACTRNSFVPANVRQGTTKSDISLTFDDQTQVSIERGKSLSTYKMNHGKDVFTKSARTVPEEVEKALRFPLVSLVDPSFSFQFDKPFLLSETGSTVASVLGSLTNVSLLHDSVRETNRRRQEVLHLIKVREQDVRDLQLDFESYRDLPLRKQEIDNIRDKFDVVSNKKNTLEDLTTTLNVLRSSQQVIDSLGKTSPKNFNEDILHLRELSKRRESLTLVIQALYTLSQSLRFSVKLANQLKKDVDLTTQQVHDRLDNLGTCPMCNQKVNK